MVRRLSALPEHFLDDLVMEKFARREIPHLAQTTLVSLYFHLKPANFI